jgi:hypothetical protein
MDDAEVQGGIIVPPRDPTELGQKCVRLGVFPLSLDDDLWWWFWN